MIERTTEAWCEAEVYRTAGEIVLLAPKQAAEKAEALTLARSQQAKSWELRVAMNMARLWRDQSKPQQGRLVQRRLHSAGARRMRLLAGAKLA